MPFDLEELYPVPQPGDGGARSFHADVYEMDAATVAAEFYSARHRLSHERRMHPTLWLKERLIHLAARRAELKQRAAA